MPIISVITVNYNNASGLENTLQSVAAQSLEDFEYVVVDGNSSDHSKEVLSVYSKDITRWISEPDTGVYQAMNKGIRLANGKYVLFLNSGDTFVGPDVLKKVQQRLAGGKDIYYGDLKFIWKRKEQQRSYPKNLSFEFFLERSLPHPGSFIKKELFDQLFYYSEDLSIVSDWEFFICAICKEKVSYEHLEMVISNFDLQGMSNDPENKEKIQLERLEVIKKHFPARYEGVLLLKQDEEARLQSNNRNKKSYISKWSSKLSRKFKGAWRSVYSRKTNDA
ncbi:MAG: glycosyltransferase [Bacteroidia bacterium]|nr:glycosyltransferase [Bacteroidia bacterium]